MKVFGRSSNFVELYGRICLSFYGGMYDWRGRSLCNTQKYEMRSWDGCFEGHFVRTRCHESSSVIPRSPSGFRMHFKWSV